MIFMRTKEIQGTYGSGKTPCTVFVYGKWYAVEGSTGVNRAYSEEELYEGVDVEGVCDSDFFTWSSPIESLEDLEEAVDN
jgi:hypothetical protein